MTDGIRRANAYAGCAAGAGRYIELRQICFVIFYGMRRTGLFAACACHESSIGGIIQAIFPPDAHYQSHAGKLSMRR